MQTIYTERKGGNFFRRLKKIKRGYYSLVILLVLTVLSLFLEFMISNRALVVHYNGDYYFPVLSGFQSGKTFGEKYEYEADYLELSEKFDGTDNYVLMPFIPYNPYESDLSASKPPPPHAPSFNDRHILGTDKNGRDIFARLAYAFRLSLFFAFGLYFFTTLIGVFFGCLMGYYGKSFDIIFQRIVEIWSMMPSLYIIMIMASLFIPGVMMLLLIYIIFDWTGMTWQMRAEIYREKSKLYCEAAKSMGASDMRIIFLHLLPNSSVPIIAALPFKIIAGISTLTALDYLGYGLPVPTPSWGEMLRQGQDSFDYAPWILLSPFTLTILILLMFTFVGEAVREALDVRS